MYESFRNKNKYKCASPKASNIEVFGLTRTTSPSFVRLWYSKATIYRKWYAQKTSGCGTDNVLPFTPLRDPGFLNFLP